jgi:predicted dehydrogenase
MDRFERDMKDLGFSSSVSRFTGYKSMLENVKPDLVIVATESGRHYEIAMDCISMGCNVLVEKPMALSLKQCRDMAYEAEEKGVNIFVGHQMRFSPAVEHIKGLIDKGAFGKIFSITGNIRWNRNNEYYRQASWRGTADMDGGTLLNQCIHVIDLVVWLPGCETGSVFSYLDNLMHPEIEVEDIGLGVIKFSNNVYGVIEGTVNTYPANYGESIYISGERGTVKISGKGLGSIEYFNVEGHEKPNLENIDSIGCMRRMYLDISSSFKNAIVSARSVLPAMSLVFSMHEASESGEMKKFDWRSDNEKK